MGLFSRWAINLLFASASIVYLLGLAIDVLEVDAAQYAAMSREMAETGNYLQVYHSGKDYLDKPPFLFWVSSIWIKIFGATNWAYKLSSFLFSIVGLISTYKLGHLLYNKRIGFVAAVLLLTSQAFFLFNHDVRTDTILTAAVIFAVWQIMSFVFYHNKWHLVGGFAGIGIGMLCKGPIALMVPALALASYFVGRKRYREFFRIEWFLGLIIVAVMLMPMLWGLYTQFDAQPEKEVWMPTPSGMQKETGLSGVRFYLWTQSFGRITGENVWSNNSPPTFFIDNFLWSFLPWSALAIWALFWRLGNTVVDVIKRRKKQEWLTLGGFLLPFIALSASSYKLPHYIFVLYPFAAIFTAEFILRAISEKAKWWAHTMTAIQTLVMLGSVAIAIYLMTVVFGVASWWVWLGFVLLIIAALLNYFDDEMVSRIVLSSAFVSMAVNWMLNAHFYPKLMIYQPGRAAAEYVEQKQIPKDKIFITGSQSFYSFEFYADHTFYDAFTPRFDSVLANHGPLWVYVGDNYLPNLLKRFPNSEIDTGFTSFRVSLLTPRFLNPETRPDELNKQFLVKIHSK